VRAVKTSSQDQKWVFELLCWQLVAAPLVLLGLRWHDLGPAQVSFMVGTPVLGLAARFRVRSGADTVSGWTLSLMGLMTVAAWTGHALAPTATLAPEALGVAMVYCALLVDPGWFRRFAVVWVLGTLVSRGVRIAMGFEGDAAAVGATHLGINIVTFALALVALDQQHARLRRELDATIHRARAAGEAALEASRAKMAFLANMSHELRTPLNAIMGYAELLTEDAPAEAADGLARITVAGRELLDRVDEVLARAQTEASEEGLPPRLIGDDEPTTERPLSLLDHQVTGASRRLTIGIGAFVAAAAPVGAIGQQLAGLPQRYELAVGAMVLGGSAAGLAAAGRLMGAHATVLVGGAVLAAWAQATVPEAAGLQLYSYTLLVLAATLLPQRLFRPAMALTVLACAGGMSARVAQGWQPSTSLGASLVLLSVTALALQLVVSRRRHQLAQLKASARRAESHHRLAQQVHHARSRFLSQMSHELRTPLTTILGHADMLVDDLQGEDLEDLQRIDGAGRHLLMLVDDILRVSSIGDPDEPAPRQIVPLQPIVDGAIDLCRPTVEANGNALLVDLDQAPATVYVHPRNLTQVLVNLLSNAGKFTEGGQVKLRVVGHLGSITIEVIDTGPGIEEHKLDRLFQPFERLDAPTRIAGTGLGLHITRRLVEQHGGQVRVTSTLGAGTIVQVHLPDERQAA